MRACWILEILAFRISDETIQQSTMEGKVQNRCGEFVACGLLRTFRLVRKKTPPIDVYTNWILSGISLLARGTVYFQWTFAVDMSNIHKVH